MLSSSPSQFFVFTCNVLCKRGCDRFGSLFVVGGMDRLFTDARPILCASTNTLVYRESLPYMQLRMHFVLSQMNECMRC